MTAMGQSETRVIEEASFLTSKGGLSLRILEHTERRDDGDGPMVTWDIEVAFGGFGVGTSHRIPIVANMPEYLEVVFGRLAKRFADMRASGRFSSVNRDHFSGLSSNAQVSVANGHDLNALLDQFPECKVPTKPAAGKKITKAREKHILGVTTARLKKRFELLRELFGTVATMGGEYQASVAKMRQLVNSVLNGEPLLVKEELVKALTEKPESLRVFMGGASEKKKRQFIDILGITDEELVTKLLHMPE